jgi:HTH-type transcriptional regulator/antitoxin HigA
MPSPIKTTSEYQAALKRIEQLWDAEKGTHEGEELEALIVLVDAFEDASFPIEPAEPGCTFDSVTQSNGVKFKK